MRERPAPELAAGGLTFDLVASKLQHPPVRPGTICRTALIQRLAKEDACRIVSVVAPAGYGKTTLLAQWAEGSDEAFAWVSVDEGDNDPKVLLTYVAEALDAVHPVGDRVFDALASPGSSVPGSVVPRLGLALSSMTQPVVLVLDDVHLLHNTECRAALSVLADHVPAGSRLVLAGRSEPPLRVARLRVEGRITEVGPRDLSLTRQEAAALLRDAGVMLGENEVTALHRQTEGWPVGLYLAALYLREGGSLENQTPSFGGDDRLVSEYFESELLAQISKRQREFLTRTAVLERMCGPLCEAVLELPGSAAMLAKLAQSNLLLVPLDRRGQWYRYHHLFRDMLLAELEQLEPGLSPVLQRRAASWCQRYDSPEEALDYHMAAGDVEVAAGLVEELWVMAYQRGRVTTILRWLRWLEDRGGIGGHPMLAASACSLATDLGRPAEAERWADALDRWQYGDAARPDNPYAEAWAAMLRAVLCRRGVEQMRADADESVRGFPMGSAEVSPAFLFQGIARILCGDLEGGDASLEDALRVAEEVEIPEVISDVLFERSLLAMARDDWMQAEALAGQAATVLRQAKIEDVYAAALPSAIQARIAWHRGDVQAARHHLIRIQRLRPLLTYAVPYFAVQALTQLTHVHLGLADLAGARTLLREIDEVLKRRPGLGTLVDEAEVLRAQLAKQRGPSAPGASALTDAELRLLPLLTTHLTFRELGAEMFLSTNTVKSQAVSIYRKLGATSRGQAVARSRELGLLER